MYTFNTAELLRLWKIVVVVSRSPLFTWWWWW